jgi:hypothetical protein
MGTRKKDDRKQELNPRVESAEEKREKGIRVKELGSLRSKREQPALEYNSV